MFEPLGEDVIRHSARAAYGAFTRSTSAPDWVELSSSEQMQWMRAAQASVEMLDGDDLGFLAGPLGLTIATDGAWYCAECEAEQDNVAAKSTEPAPPPKDG